MSQALLQGIPLRYIAERRGHSSTKMLEQIYLHAFPDKKTEYEAKLASNKLKTAEISAVLWQSHAIWIFTGGHKNTAIYLSKLRYWTQQLAAGVICQI